MERAQFIRDVNGRITGFRACVERDRSEYSHGGGLDQCGRKIRASSVAAPVFSLPDAAARDTQYFAEAFHVVARCMSQARTANIGSLQRDDADPGLLVRASGKMSVLPHSSFIWPDLQQYWPS